MTETTTTIVLFEDDNAVTLEPLTLTRPVWELRCGIRNLGEKIRSFFPGATVWEYARPYLRQILSQPWESHPQKPENALWINGGVIPGDEFVDIDGLKLGSALRINGRIIAFRGNPPQDWEAGTSCNFDGFYIREGSRETGRVINYLWELVQEMNAENTREARELRSLGKCLGELHPTVSMINNAEIFVADGVKIAPGAVLDASYGPVVLEEGVLVGAHAVIEGPTYLGPHTQVKPLTHIRGCCLGAQCRVGGELSVSIMQEYSNKQHGGFLGHSYVGAWCNLGSGTETSNLKNNYTNVKVQVGNRLVDTGSLFVGLMMGDHSKSAIGTIFNTGTVIGVGCIIFGTGFPPRFVPSFHWGGTDKLTRYPIKPTLETAAAVMKRRQRDLTDAEVEVLHWIYKNRSRS